MSDGAMTFEVGMNALPEGKRSLHDIHLKFSIADIWTIINESKLYKPQPFSFDFELTPQSKASSTSVTALPRNEYGSNKAINIAEKGKVPVLLLVALRECASYMYICTQEYHDFTGIRCCCNCHNGGPI